MSPFETVTSAIPVSFNRVLTGSAVAIAALVTGVISAGATSAATHPAVLALQTAAARWPASLPLPQAGRALPAAGSTAPGRPGVVLTAAFTTGAAHAATMQRRHGRPPRRIAIRLMHRYGWRHYQFRYLNLLWSRESGWRVRARNPASGAYGIPQAVPGAKMAAAGPHWRTSAWTQIRWGLNYIRQRYGSPHRAWHHEQATGWY